MKVKKFSLRERKEKSISIICFLGFALRGRKWLEQSESYIQMLSQGDRERQRLFNA